MLYQALGKQFNLTEPVDFKVCLLDALERSRVEGTVSTLELTNILDIHFVIWDFLLAYDEEVLIYITSKNLYDELTSGSFDPCIKFLDHYDPKEKATVPTVVLF